jgi:hypothetical protein
LFTVIVFPARAADQPTPCGPDPEGQDFAEPRHSTGQGPSLG